MKFYAITEEQIQILEKLKLRLFTENKMTGDEMRDAAQRLEVIVRVVRQFEVPT